MCARFYFPKKNDKRFKKKSYYRETSRNRPIRLTSGKSSAGSVVSTLRRIRQSTAAVVGDQANGAPIPYILNCQYRVTWIHTRQMAFIGSPALFQLLSTFYVFPFFLLSFLTQPAVPPPSKYPRRGRILMSF